MNRVFDFACVLMVPFGAERPGGTADMRALLIWVSPMVFVHGLDEVYRVLGDSRKAPGVVFRLWGCLDWRNRKTLSRWRDSSMYKLFISPSASKWGGWPHGCTDNEPPR